MTATHGRSVTPTLTDRMGNFPGRGHVASARLWIERRGGAALRRAAIPRSRILCFHSVGTPAWGVNDVTPEQFREHIDTALALGYRFVPAAELADELSGVATAPCDPGDLRLAVTFDDGVQSIATVAAPMLASYGIPWTVFIVTDWVDGKHRHANLLLDWTAIEELLGMGARIGSHSVSHPDFGTINLDDARAELEASRAVIKARLGVDVADFAIPLGQSPNWQPELLAVANDAGYDRVYAQSERRRPPGTTPRTFITRYDHARVFRAAMAGVFDDWEEWY